MTRISGAPKTEMHDCSMWRNVGFIRKRLWMRSPGISLPLKMAGISFSERTAMLIGLDPATAAAADPPLGDATTPRDVAVLQALRNVHECRIAAG